MKRIPGILLPFAFLSLTSPPTVSAESPSLAPPSAADWPMFRGEPNRQGTGTSGPTGRPVLRWRYQAQGSINPPPAIVGGVVYAISNDGILHAIDDSTGQERWQFTPAASNTVGPTVVDGVVYVTDLDGIVHAVDTASGTERWHTPGSYPGSLTFGDGRLYISTDGAIDALDAASGSALWSYAASDAGGFHTSAYANGMVYAGSDSGGYVAVDAASGKLRWKVDTGTDSTGTAVVVDGVAYLGGSGDAATGHLTAYDAKTGSQRWQLDEAIFAPSVADGVAYSGSAAVGVTAHDAATGKELWRFPLEGAARPLGIADGVVYVPADDEHRIYALDATTGSERWHFDIDGGIDGSLAVADESVYVGSALGGLYAIGGDGSPVGLITG